MFVKNNAARLISINTAKTVKYDKTGKDGKPTSDAKVVDVVPGKTFDILPAAEAVEVPEFVEKCELAKAYLDSLIKDGDVIEVSETAVKTASANDYANMSRDDLESVAGAYGVSFNANTKDETLIKAIEKAEKEA